MQYLGTLSRMRVYKLPGERRADSIYIDPYASARARSLAMAIDKRHVTSAMAIQDGRSAGR